MEEVWNELLQREVVLHKVHHFLKLDCLMEAWWRRGRSPSLLNQAIHVFQNHVQDPNAGVFMAPCLVWIRIGFRADCGQRTRPPGAPQLLVLQALDELYRQFLKGEPLPRPVISVPPPPPGPVTSQSRTRPGPADGGRFCRQGLDRP
eukprot:jgi/Botrbrau1/1305/Bobra.0063s0022.1